MSKFLSKFLAVFVLMVSVGLLPEAAGRAGLAFGQKAGGQNAGGQHAGGQHAGGQNASRHAPIVPKSPDDESEPMQFLGDTPEYCAQLERIIARQPNRPAEVRDMVTQGHQMCDHGQLRIGILYMRRALMILRHKPLILVQP
jgi:hypothetical protein